MKYFDSVAVSFLDDAVHKEIPAHAVPLSDEQYGLLIDGQANGKRILANGVNPILAEPEGPTKEQLADAVRAKRNDMLRNVYDPAVSILQRAIRMGEQGAAEKLAEFDAWAVELQAVPEQEGFPENIKWPEQPTKEL